MITVSITLTTIGIDGTSFDLYSDVDGYIVPFETGLSAATLLAGHTSTVVPDGTTMIRVKSVSVKCTNYIDLLLVTTTTSTSTSTSSTSTTSSTTTLSVACEATTSSGGSGVTEYTLNLNSLGGTIIMDFGALSVPDKLEIIHDGVKKATTGMTTPNEGPFDNLYGDPTIPTGPQATATDQFIGTSKGSIPTRNATFFSETGISGITANRQQLIWWEYIPTDYATNTQVVIRITGPSGTAWDLDRRCDPAEPTTTTTTTEPPSTTTTTSTTAAPGSEPSYRILRCGDAANFYASQTNGCIFGSPVTLSGSWSPGQYVQFVIGIECPGGATYCGQVISLGTYVPTATISSESTPPNCGDIICTE